MVPTWAISSLEVTFFEFFCRSATTASTARSTPRSQGHQRRLKRESRTSAYPPIPAISLHARWPRGSMSERCRHAEACLRSGWLAIARKLFGRKKLSCCPVGGSALRRRSSGARVLIPRPTHRSDDAQQGACVVAGPDNRSDQHCPRHIRAYAGLQQIALHLSGPIAGASRVYSLPLRVGTARMNSAPCRPKPPHKLAEIAAVLDHSLVRRRSTRPQRRGLPGTHQGR
jgi:hypothetical protein